MEKLTFTKSAGGNNAPIKRDSKAVLTGAEVFGEVKEDRNGSPYATIKFNFSYNGDDGKGRETSLMTTLPYSLKDDSVSTQILELAKIRWSEIKDGEQFEVDLSKFENLDCVIHVGAERAEYDDKNGLFRKGEPKVYEKDGELKLSSSVIGVFPLSSFGKTWTETMDEEQKAIYEEFKTMRAPGSGKPVDPNFGKAIEEFDV